MQKQGGAALTASESINDNKTSNKTNKNIWNAPFLEKLLEAADVSFLDGAARLLGQLLELISLPGFKFSIVEVVFRQMLIFPHFSCMFQKKAHTKKRESCTPVSNLKIYIKKYITAKLALCNITQKSAELFQGLK